MNDHNIISDADFPPSERDSPPMRPGVVLTFAQTKNWRLPGPGRFFLVLMRVSCYGMGNCVSETVIF
jgi:hypothetical protein